MDSDIEIHPDSYDLIVLGTGLPESILAAAAASSGLTVLHIDSGDVYGSAWASLSPDAFQRHAGSGSRCEADGVVSEPEGEWRFVSTAGSSPFSGFKQGVLKEEAGLGRVGAYNLDLAGPKLAFSAGELVDLLLRSGATSYLEFKAVESTYLRTKDGLVAVPSSQAEVFRDQSLSLVEKRLLMRFLKVVTDQSSGAGSISEENLDMPFVEFLRQQQLPASVRAMILYAIVFAESDQEGEGETGEKWTARDALQRLALYRASVGRFTNAPGAFIYPLHGQGELPQAFCRAAAVKGAVYVLRRPVDAIVVDRASGCYRGVRTRSGQLLFSQTLVAGRALLPHEVEDELAEPSSQGFENGSANRATIGLARGKKVARLVCVTDCSIKAGQGNILVVIPPGSVRSGLSSVIYALQLEATASVCPHGQFVIQLSTLCQDGEADWEDILVTAAEALLSGAESAGTAESQGTEGDGSRKPKVLWSGFFLNAVGQTKQLNLPLHGQVAVFSMPDHTIDYAGVVRDSEEIFRKLFPTREFFAGVNKVEDEVADDENGDLSQESS